MKARTKNQRRVEAASRRLPRLTAAQVEWARTRLFDHVGFWSGAEVWCSDCGHVFAKPDSDKLADTLDNAAVCPHCGRPLKVIRSRRLKINDREYMSIVTTCQGLQVIRTFECRRQGRKGQGVDVTINEVVQQWLNAEGQCWVTACNRAPFSYYEDRWVHGTMSLKSDTTAYRFQGALYPRRRVLPILRRNGYRPLADAIEWDVMRLLLANPHAETLIKAGQDALLATQANRQYYDVIGHWWPSIKVAIRHGYIVKDATMWCDMMRFAEELGLDLHSPHYVCPADLKVAHDRLQARVERKRARERAQREREEARAAESSYRERKGRFFALRISTGDITIRPLCSVAEFVAEGKAMHHCVSVQKYYNRADSLILTARDAEDKRLETVEVDLTTYRVVQSRGVNNTKTDYHDRIVSIVNTNINKIKKLAKNETSKSASYCGY